jgi:plastocyanin
MRVIQAAGAAFLAFGTWAQPPHPADQPGNQPPAPPGSAFPPAAVVVMTNELRFSPRAVTVDAGQYVLWRNRSREPHTVTDRPGEPGPGGAAMTLPAGAAPFDSGPVAAGSDYERRFDTVGTYRYACRYDGPAGMVGVVEVQPPPATVHEHAARTDRAAPRPAPSIAPVRPAAGAPSTGGPFDRRE